MKRKIAVVTTSRADYSHLYWVLRDLRDDPRIGLRLIVTAAHLAAEFGRAVEEIEADGFRVDHEVDCLVDSDTDTAMAQTIGLATLGLAAVLSRMRPDLLLLIADRYELLAPASVALALRIPIAHIEGGEISEGAVDDAVRNAVTKMSHLHFTPTAAACKRVLSMGEEPWRVHHVGAPSLDYLTRERLLSAREIESELETTIDRGSILVAYHPVTIARETLREADELFAALCESKGQILFCFPNADAGSRELIQRARSFCALRPDARIFVNLNPRRYWSLLRRVGVMLGNSSSAIMESPSLALPAVNVGMRQQGRERARNILDAAPDCGSIVDKLRIALSAEFRRGLEGMSSPYGDGHAAKRIAGILASAPIGEALLLKRAAPSST